MASITPTTIKTGERRYRVRYRDPGGNTRERWFRRKLDAGRFAATTEADLVRGQWIDPQAGRVTLAEYLADWWSGRSHIRESSRVTQDSLVRNHPRLLGPVDPHAGCSSLLWLSTRAPATRSAELEGPNNDRKTHFG